MNTPTLHPFNLELAKAGKRVQRRDGGIADELYIFSGVPRYPICVRFDKAVLSFTLEGKSPASGGDSEYDLFMVDAPFDLQNLPGFPLGDGQRWHQDDFTEKDLAGGFRPLLYNERVETDDHWYSAYGWNLVDSSVGMSVASQQNKYRTRRPFKEGKPAPLLTPRQIADGWILNTGVDPKMEKVEVLFADLETVDGKSSSQWCWSTHLTNVKILAYRPAQKKVVPLGPEDVPPGSVLRYIDRSPNGYHWFAIESLPAVCDGVQIHTGAVLTFATLKEKCEISRNDGKGFVPCTKEAK